MCVWKKIARVRDRGNTHPLQNLLGAPHVHTTTIGKHSTPADITPGEMHSPLISYGHFQKFDLLFTVWISRCGDFLDFPCLLLRQKQSTTITGKSEISDQHLVKRFHGPRAPCHNPEAVINFFFLFSLGLISTTKELSLDVTLVSDFLEIGW